MQPPSSTSVPLVDYVQRPRARPLRPLAPPPPLASPGPASAPASSRNLSGDRGDRPRAKSHTNSISYEQHPGYYARAYSPNSGPGRARPSAVVPARPHAHPPPLPPLPLQAHAMAHPSGSQQVIYVPLPFPTAEYPLPPRTSPPNLNRSIPLLAMSEYIPVDPRYFHPVPHQLLQQQQQYHLSALQQSTAQGPALTYAFPPPARPPLAEYVQHTPGSATSYYQGTVSSAYQPYSFANGTRRGSGIVLPQSIAPFPSVPLRTLSIAPATPPQYMHSETVGSAPATSPVDAHDNSSPPHPDRAHTSQSSTTLTNATASRQSALANDLSQSRGSSSEEDFEYPISNAKTLQHAAEQTPGSDTVEDVPIQLPSPPLEPSLEVQTPQLSSMVPSVVVPQNTLFVIPPPGGITPSMAIPNQRSSPPSYPTSSSAPPLLSTNSTYTTTSSTNEARASSSSSLCEVPNCPFPRFCVLSPCGDMICRDHLGSVIRGVRQQSTEPTDSGEGKPIRIFECVKCKKRSEMVGPPATANRTLQTTRSDSVAEEPGHGSGEVAGFSIHYFSSGVKEGQRGWHESRRLSTMAPIIPVSQPSPRNLHESTLTKTLDSDPVLIPRPPSPPFLLPYYPAPVPAGLVEYQSPALPTEGQVPATIPEEARYSTFYATKSLPASELVAEQDESTAKGSFAEDAERSEQDPVEDTVERSEAPSNPPSPHLDQRSAKSAADISPPVTPTLAAAPSPTTSTASTVPPSRTESSYWSSREPLIPSTFRGRGRGARGSRGGYDSSFPGHSRTHLRTPSNATSPSNRRLSAAWPSPTTSTEHFRDDQRQEATFAVAGSTTTTVRPEIQIDTFLSKPVKSELRGKFLVVKIENIPFGTTYGMIQDWLPSDVLPSFDDCPQPIHIILHRLTGRTLPHCYVEVKDRESALLLLTDYDRRQLGDRTVRVKMERVGEFMRDIFDQSEYFVESRDGSPTSPAAARLPPLPQELYELPEPLLTEDDFQALDDWLLPPPWSHSAGRPAERGYTNVASIIAKVPWTVRPDLCSEKMRDQLYDLATSFTAAQRTQLSPLSIEEFPPLSAQASPTSPTNKIFDRKNLVPLSPTSPSTTLRLEPSPVPADWRHSSNVRSQQGDFADNKATQGTRGERESDELQVEVQKQTHPVLDDWAQAFSTNAQTSFTATQARDSVRCEGIPSGPKSQPSTWIDVSRSDPDPIFDHVPASTSKDSESSTTTVAAGSGWIPEQCPPTPPESPIHYRRRFSRGGSGGPSPRGRGGYGARGGGGPRSDSTGSWGSFS
ncbi:uncharacterized protein JCM15063_002016 [Sporobolomyces koalae]|uniref:uncharacterized protein n=1 Tax=Sporobolomyces koalae TaxID=500713 RepID=UPI003182745B